MVTVDRFDYVFIKKAGNGRPVRAATDLHSERKHDVVIVAEPSRDHPGLTPGQEVVTTGSLILEELYEDKEMTEGGFLVSREGESKRGIDRATQPLDRDIASRHPLII